MTSSCQRISVGLAHARLRGCQVFNCICHAQPDISVNKILQCFWSQSMNEGDSSDQAVVVVVVVGVNFFSFSTSLKPLHGFASNFVWMFIWVDPY